MLQHSDICGCEAAFNRGLPVINNSTDHHQLVTDAKAAKQVLGVDELEVLSDKGFYVANDSGM